MKSCRCYEGETVFDGANFLPDYHAHLGFCILRPLPPYPLSVPTPGGIIADSSRHTAMNTLWMDALVTDAEPGLALFFRARVHH